MTLINLKIANEIADRENNKYDSLVEHFHKKAPKHKLRGF
jgi:hypothetical protein